MSLRSRTTTAGQQCKPIVEPIKQLPKSKCGGAGSGQFDCQRYAVKAAAN